MLLTNHETSRHFLLINLTLNGSTFLLRGKCDRSDIGEKERNQAHRQIAFRLATRLFTLIGFIPVMLKDNRKG